MRDETPKNKDLRVCYTAGFQHKGRHAVDIENGLGKVNSNDEYPDRSDATGAKVIIILK